MGTVLIVSSLFLCFLADVVLLDRCPTLGGGPMGGTAARHTDFCRYGLLCLLRNRQAAKSNTGRVSARPRRRQLTGPAGSAGF